MHVEVRTPLLSFNADKQPRIRFVWQTITREWKISGYWHTKTMHASWYPGRNYDEFAILAGVRNYNNYVPLSSPRGIPENVSEDVARDYASWGVDAHSASWLTVEEILTNDDYWNKTVTMSGFVSEEDAKRFHETGERPEAWSGWLTNGVEITWEESYRERAKYLLTNLVPTLREMLWKMQFSLVSRNISTFWEDAEIVDYARAFQEDLPDEDEDNVHLPAKPESYRMTEEDIRLVFWFDN